MVRNQLPAQVVKQETKRNEQTFTVAACVGSRHVVTLMLFLGMANAYVMRTNMSVAIVAMINHTAIVNTEDDEVVASKCGTTNTTVSGRASEPCLLA